MRLRTTPQFCRSVLIQSSIFSCKAIQNGHFEAVRLLVSKKANLKHKNNRGCNVLHFTALSDNLQIFYFLMDFEEGSAKYHFLSLLNYVINFSPKSIGRSKC